jgi:hypothetical protein
VAWERCVFDIHEAVADYLFPLLLISATGCRSRKDAERTMWHHASEREIGAGPTGDQVNVARGILGWMRLSGYCGVSDVTIRNFERGKSGRPAPEVEAIQRALELGGVEFMQAQPMVRLKGGK